MITIILHNIIAAARFISDRLLNGLGFVGCKYNHHLNTYQFFMTKQYLQERNMVLGSIYPGTYIHTV